MTDKRSDAPIAWIEHHKGGDNLVWEQTSLPCTPLYKTPVSQATEEKANPCGRSGPVDAGASAPSQPDFAKLADWIAENAPDCGDNSCLFGGASRGGMGTNGRCRCFGELPTTKRIFVERLYSAFRLAAIAAEKGKL